MTKSSPASREPVAAGEKNGTWYLRILRGALIAGGLALLFYVGCEYTWMYVEQQRMSRELQSQTANPAAAEGRSSGTDLARLLIPKIRLNAMVLEGLSRKGLLTGPVHLEQTAPLGESGNAVVAGHRDTFFRHLGELKAGDPIYVDRGGNVFQYRVTGTKIVEPNQVDVMKASEGRKLTLITCYPFHYLGPAPKRYIVFAEIPDAVSYRRKVPSSAFDR